MYTYVYYYRRTHAYMCIKYEKYSMRLQLSRPRATVACPNICTLSPHASPPPYTIQPVAATVSIERRRPAIVPPFRVSSSDDRRRRRHRRLPSAGNSFVVTRRDQRVTEPREGEYKFFFREP